MGGIGALLATLDTVSIESSCSEGHGIAVQIAQNLFQYYAADSEMNNAGETSADTLGCIISVHLGNLDIQARKITDGVFHPLSVSKNGIALRKRDGTIIEYSMAPGLGAIYVSPRPAQGITLTVWGADLEGLHQAARLVPMLTGVGQPDFVVMRRECSYQGVAGVAAMGFFDHTWNISEASYIDVSAYPA